MAPGEGAETPAFVRALSEPGCRFELGEPIELDLPVVGDSASGFEPWYYSFSYDVNGDGVGDLFFRSSSSSARTLGTTAMLLSRLTDSSVEYALAPCDAFDGLPGGRTYTEDLDGDRIPDLVIGTTNGVVGFLNRPSGFVELVRHDWNSAGWSSILDLEIVDLDGNGRQDIVTSYDRNFGGSLDFERGVLAFLDHGVATEPRFETRQWSTFSEVLSQAPMFLSFSLVDQGRVPALLLLEEDYQRDNAITGRLVSVAETGPDVEVVVALNAPPSSGTQASAYAAWAVTFQDREAIAVLSSSRLFFYDLSGRSSDPIAAFYTLEIAGEHKLNNEPGGGNEWTMRFLTDVEGDGDLDFIEALSAHYGAPFAIHRNLSGQAFADPQVIQVRAQRNGDAPSPFVAIGTAKAALIVNDNKHDYTDDSMPLEWLPGSVQPLRCAEL